MFGIVVWKVLSLNCIFTMFIRDVTIISSLYDPTQATVVMILDVLAFEALFLNMFIHIL